jgi:hypothetical protein
VAYSRASQALCYEEETGDSFSLSRNIRLSSSLSLSLREEREAERLRTRYNMAHYLFFRRTVNGNAGRTL